MNHNPLNNKKIGVLVVNLGTPDAPTSSAVSSYLRQFLSDQRVIAINPFKWKLILNCLVLPTRSPKVAKVYQSIWTDQGSPLLVHSQAIVDGIRTELGSQYQVELAMTYKNPSIKQGLDSLLSKLDQSGKIIPQHLDKLIIVPLYPQYSSTTTAAVFDAVADQLKAYRNLPPLEFVHSYHLEPLYIQALADSITSHFTTHPQQNPVNNPQAKLLISFHGIPQSYQDQGDNYPIYCFETAQAIAKLLQLQESHYQVTFQSIFGKDPWVQPYTQATLNSYPSQGITSVTSICPGFAVDCIETIDEIAIEAKEEFIAAGGQEFSYINCLNEQQIHFDLFCSLIRAKAKNK